jgi:hypothetical protein
VQQFDKTVPGCRSDLGLDPVTKPVDLGTLIIDLGLLQVDTYTFHSVVTNTTLLSPARLTGDYLDQAAGGGEAISLATTVDLRLFDYSHEFRCCI